MTKLAPDGAAYPFSTFLGGSRDDNGTEIALDALGQLHIIDHTSSTDFPGNDGSGSAGHILVSLLDATGSDLIRTLQIDSPVAKAGQMLCQLGILSSGHSAEIALVVRTATGGS